ncbi:MAG: iron-containing alcohol dehydrogenase [Anaerolineales bacterium]|nr:iron-containing alcohol dehydrogenase [Anaerolineales bacterium]
MRFEFATAGRIIFGAGALAEVGPLAAGMGRRAFVVIGHTRPRAQPLLDVLAGQGLDVSLFQVPGEPTNHLVRQGVQAAREHGSEVVIGFGGGSVLDAGKAISLILTNGGRPMDYLEVIGAGRAFTQPAAPYIAIPTTAGTGTEVTRNAVLTVPEEAVKVSLRSPYLLPRVAVVDPELTYSVPPAITAATGLDALTQLIEPYVTPRHNAMTDPLCRDGMGRVAHSLLRAYQNGENAAARSDMALASLFGGLALANAKLGAVHGFASVLGGMFHAPHGAVCGCLLAPTMAVTIHALRHRRPDSDALHRYEEVARIFTDDPQATAAAGVAWVEALCQTLKVPGLGSYGVAERHFPELIQKASVSSSMQGNPIKLTPDEMHEVLRRAL